ncbi:30S ribosomal protein S6 [Columbia Basin potato purple top phytoplasma]|uniref:Small ribosomal subunit protein bS6 n=1 Tax=Columbia Basin potato purple top phytoplasma TaxID=307134 RepID=A0ABT5L985_9MOLU|nr:30S ribosomal protein S6 [Columbia Basin potato purple top phytoplasma]MDC9031786.1 30S ribosomal protein S6 [Columbia Basin potato purple top phytoplasma]
MRKYEILYILKPTLNEKQVDEIKNKINSIFEKEDNKLEYQNTELKTLAYPVQKFTQGFYNNVLVKANNDMVTEFNRIANITEEIIRYVILRLDKK